ncbi:Protein of unknown function [Chitinasiproducens palmae]|uniref:DUF551 domain-containing protein n=1 Tax=Chitinasiproducens palmae TaxID=1770053 RepID=A0A1H2PR39_9BURK|nr:Protein of unknown function [Chitinasiproducens palmae]
MRESGSGCSEVGQALLVLDDAVPRWISVDERLPVEHENVAVMFDDGGYATAWAAYWHGARSDFAKWMFALDEIGEERTVTHWMPLPSAPEVGR